MFYKYWVVTDLFVNLIKGSRGYTVRNLNIKSFFRFPLNFTN